jgi:hypothetical protein
MIGLDLSEFQGVICSENTSSVTFIKCDFQDVTELVVASNRIISANFSLPVDEIIIRECKEIEKISSDAGLSKIYIVINLFHPHVVNLVLDDLPNLIDKDFQYFSDEFWCCLKSLKISRCNSLTGQLLEYSSPFWKDLEVFQFTCRFFVNWMEPFDKTKEVYYQVDDKYLKSLFDGRKLKKLEIQLDYISDESLGILNGCWCIEHLHLILFDYGELSMIRIMGIMIIHSLLTCSITVKTVKIVDFDRTQPESYLKLSNFAGDDVECDKNLKLIIENFEQVMYYELVNFLQLSDTFLSSICTFCADVEVLRLINCGNCLNRESFGCILHSCKSLKLLVVTKVEESSGPTRIEVIPETRLGQNKQVIFAVQCGMQKWDYCNLKALKNQFGELKHHYDWMVAHTFNFSSEDAAVRKNEVNNEEVVST